MCLGAMPKINNFFTFRLYSRCRNNRTFCRTSTFKMKNRFLPYLPGILLFLLTLVIAFLTYKDYGISWDELDQRKIGTLTYNYITSGDQALFKYAFRQYGTGFELPLIFFEKWFKLTDTREVYQMRHLVTHILFLISALSVYIMSFRLTRNTIIASLCFIMMAFAPRIYAHSFFNTKDIPFLCMFIITLAFSQLAFDKNKPAFYIVLGLLAGYTTSIRVMGIMLCGFLAFMLFLDFWAQRNDKEGKKKALINLAAYLGCYALMLTAAWPYLWKNPLGNFIESYVVMSHYNWDAYVLLRGNYEHTTELPWSYFPTWFVITTPILWTACGAAGFGMIIKDFFKNAKTYFKNSNERNYMLYLACFIVPVFAVIKLNAVIYDDWRHLYFVYPPFVLLGIYFIHKMFATKFKWVVVGVCALQVALVGFFMVQAHPFQQVYFNELTSKGDQSLRLNYEMEYWGCSFKQGLEHLVAKQPTDTIRLCCNYDDPVKNNILMLQAKDRGRFVFTDVKHADYFVTNFRGHAEDYPSKNIEYEINVLDNCIMRIYNLKQTPAQAK